MLTSVRILIFQNVFFSADHERSRTRNGVARDLRGQVPPVPVEVVLAEQPSHALHGLHFGDLVAGFHCRASRAQLRGQQEDLEGEAGGSPR